MSIPGTDIPSGRGLAILVNANAKRGGRRIGVQIARRLNGATVRLTKSIPEIEAWLRILKPQRCILAAGGDGTAVALLNALHHVIPPDEPLPPIGILPLGTGNGWANALGAPKLDRCLRILTNAPEALPFRRYGVVECEGILTPFAGSGYDAMVLEDYKQQLAASRGPSKRFSKSVWGYISATLLRTAPKVVLYGNPHVLIENLGDEVFTMTPEGKLQKLEGVGYGSILFDGKVGAASVGTAPEFGYGFRAFPFAERMLGYMNVRAYERSALPAVLSMPQLWRGAHPLPGMHDWFATAVRMTFSRQVPLQIGGDAHGMRRTVEYRISGREVRMLDWRRLI